MQFNVDFANGQVGLPGNVLVDTSQIHHEFCQIEGSNSPLPKAPVNAYVAPHQTCGVFDVYYEDILTGLPYGFNHPGAGAARRNTICAVLTYIQGVFDFGQVPAIDHIRLEIQQSFENGFNNPPATWQTTIAAATPEFPAVAQINPGYYSGFMYDKVNSYPDYQAYNYTDFDGRIRFNFSAMAGNTPVNLQVNHTLPLANCETDMYSVALHEVLHLMGWFSMIQEDANQVPQHNNSFINNVNSFSHLDQHNLFHGDIFTNSYTKWVINNPNPVINPVLQIPNTMRDNLTWMRSLPRFQDNHPVYSGSTNLIASPLAPGSLFSHLEGQHWASTRKFWISPGFRPLYVMEPFMAAGIRKREITNEELRDLLGIGYSLNAAFANTLAPNSNSTWGAVLGNNHKPECETDFSLIFNVLTDLGQWNEGLNPANNVTVDFTVPNNGMPLLINLNSLPNKIVDADGDIIRAIPETLVGIRGVSDGDNNHARHSFINNNQTIVYLPRPNFIGRAQFYVQLSDGKEAGSLALFTVDVTFGGAFINTPPNEMVINGGFEEGTEVKDFNTLANQNKNGNNNVAGLYEGQFFLGYSLSDAAPLYHLNNMWSQNAGAVSRNAAKTCPMPTVPYSFGFVFFSFPNNAIPPSTNLNNKRYSYFRDNGWHTNFSTLATSPLLGHYYEISYDVFLPVGFASGNFLCNINFTNQFDLNNPINTFSQQFNLNVLPGTGQWQHVTYQFEYCSNLAAYFMELIPVFPQFNATWGPFIDNISLIEIPNPTFVLQAVAAPNVVNCNNNIVTINAVLLPNPCSVVYSWQPGNLAGATVSVNPTVTTIYTVTATDQNNNTNTTTVSVQFLNNLSVSANAAPSFICPGGNTTLTASGANTYVWQPGNLTGTSVVVAPNATTIYTVTGTGGNMCTATTTAVVNVGNNNAIACCNPVLVANPNAQYFVNATAYDIVALYTATVNTTDILLVEGVLAIDQNITFNGCPNIRFGPNAKIVFNGPFTLTFNDCTLESACPEMWDGIEVTFPGAQLHCTNNYIRHMEQGILVTGTATGLFDGNNFENNYIAIDLRDLPNGNATAVLGNLFLTLPNVNLLPPHQTLQRGMHGLKITNCVNFTVGSFASHNTFRKWYNGIFIRHTVPYSTANTTTTSYNLFDDIQDGPTLWAPAAQPNYIPFSQDPAGCAIFAYNDWVTSMVHLKHEGNNDAAQYDFQMCQKGILQTGYHVDIQHNYTNQTHASFLNYKAENKTHKILYNHMYNTYLGAGLYGNSNGGGISQNEISVLAHPVFFPPYNNQSMFWGKGVEMLNYTGSPMTYMAINLNQISSAAPDWVIGINIANSPYGPRRENVIQFSSNDNTYQPYLQATLRGIALSNTTHNLIESNTISATYGPAQQNRRTVGLYLSKSKANEINCNSINQTMTGVEVIGDCGSSQDDLFKGNLLNPNAQIQATHKYGLLLRHLGTEGSLGNIGNLQKDNNNTFGPLTSYTSGFKVFRVCNATNGERFYTHPSRLTLQESGSTNNCKYDVFQNNQGYYNYTCSSGGFDPAQFMTASQALLVALDSVAYPEYYAMAAWMDDMTLFRMLREDTLMRYSHPTLTAFYDSMCNHPVAAMSQIDSLIMALSDSLTGMDAATYMSILAEAQDRNSQLSDENTQLENEQFVNEVYLRYQKFGIDSIEASTWEALRVLAWQCPYIGGTAVYKARSLNALLEPGAYYDDLTICNYAGVYKGGEGLFDQENVYLEGLAPAYTQTLQDDLISVYPNPAHNLVHIRKQTPFVEAQWYLMDLAGKVILQGFIPEKSLQCTIPLPGLAQGVYQLLLFDQGVRQVNKLIIE